MQPSDFTGERFIPGVIGAIAYEHCHRYAFTLPLARGRRVLDAACGEGYGAALLAQQATTVVGVDIDADAISAASARYGDRTNLKFKTASVVKLPFADASMDLVVSFETIEHVSAADQRRMLTEFARVLTLDGILILSSPNRPEYSEARGYVNPYHLHELDREELEQLLGPAFPNRLWYHQRRYLGSALWGGQAGTGWQAIIGDAEMVDPSPLPPATYFIVVAARDRTSLPVDMPTLSLYADREDSEWKRIDGEAREVLRLDQLLGKRDRELAQLAGTASDLRDMIAHRDQALADNEGTINELRRSVSAKESELSSRIQLFSAERERLLREIEFVRRALAYRESVRGWLVLPALWLRRIWRRWSAD